MVAVLRIIEVTSMTIQDMKTCLSNTYEIRRTDLILPYEEKKRLLEGKYPTKDLLGNRVISSRMHPVLDTFMANSLDEDYLDATQLRQFSDQLYLEHGLFQEDTMEMREIIEVLRIHLKAGCRYSAETVERLFDYAFDLYLDDPEFYPGPNGTEPLDRQIQAAKRLRRYISQDWAVQCGRICMDQSIMEQLQEELDRRISHIGGVVVLRALLQSEFHPNYDRQMDRFMILRPKRSGSGGRNFMTLPKAAVPVNYLIQIALKHVTPLAGPYRTQVADIRTIKEIARDMMTVLRLSDAESMSDILVPPEQLPNYIQDNAQYDSMCIPFQCDPGFCTWVVEKFYLPFAQKAGLVSIKRTYLPVLRWCLRQQSLYFFKAEDIQHEIGLGLKQVESVLDICSQAAEDVNRDFRSLADDMTAQNYPLIRLPDGSYFQLDPHLSGYAFCECIYRQIKGRVRNFDRNLGVSLELLIKNKLAERKIPFSCGHYTDMEGKDRDCDLILEGTDIILFMEIKKRPLPGKFQQGDSLEIFSGKRQISPHLAIVQRK